MLESQAIGFICLHCEKSYHHRHLFHDLDSFLAFPFTFLTYTLGEAGGAGVSISAFFSCATAGSTFVAGAGTVPVPFCFLAGAPAEASSRLTSGVPFFTERKGVLDLAGILGGACNPEVPLCVSQRKSRERFGLEWKHVFCLNDFVGTDP